MWGGNKWLYRYSNYECRGTNVVVRMADKGVDYRKSAKCLQTSSRQVLPCALLSTCELGQVRMKFIYKG
jgi:hypothetical protein